jgi:hypothetical protein
MISHPTQEVKISTADPSAIGLFGLAMVTLVASSQNLQPTPPALAGSMQSHAAQATTSINSLCARLQPNTLAR